MKSFWVTLVAFLVALSLTAPAFAQTKPGEKAKPAKPAATAEKPAKAEPAKRHQVTGEIVSVDAAAKTVVVKHKEKEMTFTVTEKAAKALADVKAGDKATVKYTEAEGKFTARSIMKAKPAIKAKKPAEPKKL